jgi:hypothetical protein
LQQACALQQVWPLSLAYPMIGAGPCRKRNAALICCFDNDFSGSYIMTKLMPYGAIDHTVAKVGKSKTPTSLVERMPSPAIAAKVGQVVIGRATRRVVRRSALG